MANSASTIKSDEIRRFEYSNNFNSKLKTYGFAILIIVGIGGLAVAGAGLGSFGIQQGWWQAGSLSNLSQIHSITMMAAGSGVGIVFLVIGIVGSVKNKGNIGKGLSGLLVSVNLDSEKNKNNIEQGPISPSIEGNLNSKAKFSDHKTALEFARKILEEHPEVKPNSMDWGCFAKKGILSSDDKSPSNPEISRLSYIFQEIWLPKLDAIVNPPKILIGYKKTDEQGKPLQFQPAIYKQNLLEDPWADKERAEVADTCLKLSYALVCLTCDDMPAMKRKLPKRYAKHFDFSCQYSYQYRWVVLHTTIYQMVRHASDKQEHSQPFYQEGSLQCQWRNLFNHHCDYVSNCGWSLGDARYYKWFKKDTLEEPLAKLDSHSLPT